MGKIFVILSQKYGKDFFMQTQQNIFTSESVCAGHPDKICDRISDTILDALIAQDPDSKSGIECVVGNNQISLFGEIKSRANVDFKSLTLKTIEELGYTNPDWGFSSKSHFSNYLHQQSPDISLGVDEGGAGDQGMMFGYAISQTDSLMPLPIVLAHQLVQKIDQLRINKTIKWLRPDGKAQVTLGLAKNKVEVLKLVAAVAHSEDVDHQLVRRTVIKEVFEPVLAKFRLKLPQQDKDMVVNGTGVWHIPGPTSDAGLTGRKIVVDGYGGYARVGGGAFSGKDPSKVDRSGAYAARYIAKNIVASGLAKQCEVGLAYVIGQSRPLMLSFNTFDQKVDLNKLKKFSENLIDTSVNGIIRELNLKRPIYHLTSCYGHFGKNNLPWEKVI